MACRRLPHDNEQAIADIAVSYAIQVECCSGCPAGPGNTVRRGEDRAGCAYGDKLVIAERYVVQLGCRSRHLVCPGIAVAVEVRMVPALEPLNFATFPLSPQPARDIMQIRMRPYIVAFMNELPLNCLKSHFQGDPGFQRIGRMGVNVIYPGRRFTRKPGDIVIIDVTRLVVENIEEIHHEPPVFKGFVMELVADPGIDDGAGM